VIPFCKKWTPAFRYVDADDIPRYFLRRLRYVCTQLPTRGNGAPVSLPGLVRGLAAPRGFAREAG
jgi:hypothetical protein